jgi:GAF domain-containing protein
MPILQKKTFFVTIFTDITDSFLLRKQNLFSSRLNEKLQEASRAVLKYRDFEESAVIIFNECRELIGAQAGYVALLTDDGHENDVLYLNPGAYICEVDPELPMPIRGLRGEAYNLSSVVYDNNFMKSPHLKFIPPGHVDMENVLFAPLMHEGKAIGLMGIANKVGGFTDEDATVAQAFSEIASIALLNSRTFHDLKETIALKDLLLSELNHRIKNNLNMVSNLLGIQVNRTMDEDVIMLLKDSQQENQNNSTDSRASL